MLLDTSHLEICFLFGDWDFDLVASAYLLVAHSIFISILISVGHPTAPSFPILTDPLPGPASCDVSLEHWSLGSCWIEICADVVARGDN